MEEVHRLICEAYSKALAKKADGADLRQIHNTRSRNWVGALHQQFVKKYSDKSDVRVFSKYNQDNRKEFSLNELLFDISVCQVATVSSVRHGKKLTYIKKALWQVESEFAKNSRQTVKDFSKLVTGSADNKIFVGSYVSNVTKFIKVLIPIADACSGTVYLALLPHPSKWGLSIDDQPNTWRFVEGKWLFLE